MKNLKTRFSLLLALILSLSLIVGFGVMAEEAAVEDATANVLTYEGMLARTKGDSGIRSMFTINKDALETLKNAGYTVEIGAIMGLSKLNGNSYFTVNDLTVKSDGEKGFVAEKDNLAVVVVYSSTGADYATNKYVVETGSQCKFAFTTLFSEGYENALYYTAEFCYRGFIALTKDDATNLIYVDADGEVLGDSISLYEVVSYFVSDYAGPKAEEAEYQSLEKFQNIEDAVATAYPELAPLPRLATPEITLTSHPTNRLLAYAKFPVDNAISYKYQIDDENIKSTTRTQIGYDINDGAKIRVMAVADGETYRDSKWSEWVTYTAPEKVALTTPNVTVTPIDRQTATASWGKIGNAIGFAYKINGGDVMTVDTSVLSVTINAGDTISVWALADSADSSYYKDSEAAVKSYNPTVTKLATPALTVKATSRTSATVTWAKIANATGYAYKINGGETVETSGLSVTINDGDTISVWAIGVDTATAFYDNSDVAVASYEAPEEVTLATPEVTLTPVDRNTATVTWVTVENATKYGYSVNGETSETANNKAEKVTLNAGDTFKVWAIGDESGYYADSAASEPVTYNPTVTKLATPEITLTTVATNRLQATPSWTAVDNATTYRYQINENEPVERKVLSLTTQLSDGDTFKVWAIGDGENGFYEDSDAAVMTYTAPAQKKLPAPTVSINLIGTASWTAVDNAKTYSYQIKAADSEEYGDIVTKNALTATLKDGETIRVWAVGTGDAGYYADSDAVEMTYTAPESPIQLADPVISVENGVATWTPVENVIYYIYWLRGTSTKVYEVVSIELHDGDTLVVQAQGDNRVVLHSKRVSYGPYVDPDVETLPAPEVTIDENGIVTWSEVPNATGYTYKIDGGEETLADGTDIVLTEGQTITVMAIGDVINSTWRNSEWSLEKTYDDPNTNPVMTPVVSISLAGVATWQPVENATGYNYQISGGEVQYTEVPVEVQLAENQTITVMAIGAGGNYQDSAWSEPMTYTAPKPLATPTVEVNALTGEVTITAVDNATGYVYVINGGEEKTADGTSIILANGETIKVKALGNGGLYLDSDWSDEVTFSQKAQLPTPVITLTPNTKNRLQALAVFKVENATAYYYQIDDGVATRNGTGQINVNDGSKIRVMAVGDGETYINSEWSEWVTYTAPEKVTLATPNVTVTPINSQTGTASWDPIDNATGYTYTINGGETVTLKTTSVLLNAGETIVVWAVGDGTKDYFGDSAQSTPVTYTPPKQTQLPKPNVTITPAPNALATVSWEAIPGATGYMYQITDATGVTADPVEVKNAATQVAGKLGAGCKIQVMAVGDNDLYLDSEWSDLSEPYTPPVMETLATPTVTINPETGMASWEAISNASSYYVRITGTNGGNQSTYSATSIQLKEGQSIEVRANGDNIYYTNSAFSAKVGPWDDPNTNPLPTPEVTIDENGIVTWSEDLNATGYIYKIDGGEETPADGTVIVLTEGQKITVKALGNGAEWLDSDWSPEKTYVAGGVETEWEFDLTDSANYTLKGTGITGNSDGVTFAKLGSTTNNYIIISVNVSKAGLYDISFKGASPSYNAILYIVNTSTTDDGWNAHNTAAYFAKGSTQSVYTFGTTQYLKEGTNELYIYAAGNTGYIATAIKISLNMANTDATTHVVLNSDNARGSNGIQTTGTLSIAVKGTVEIDLSISEGAGTYMLYVLGASNNIRSTATANFTLGDEKVEGWYLAGAAAPKNYATANLYEIGEFALTGNEDTLTIYSGALMQIHRIILVKVSD